MMAGRIITTVEDLMAESERVSVIQAELGHGGGVVHFRLSVDEVRRKAADIIAGLVVEVEDRFGIMYITHGERP